MIKATSHGYYSYPLKVGQNIILTLFFVINLILNKAYCMPFIEVPSESKIRWGNQIVKSDW